MPPCPPVTPEVSKPPLMVMAPQDPDRAAYLFDLTKLAVEIATRAAAETEQ